MDATSAGVPRYRTDDIVIRLRGPAKRVRYVFKPAAHECRKWNARTWDGPRNVDTTASTKAPSND